MAIIGTLPNNIQNGQSVDANPVMADFNFIVNQVNANANPIGTLTAPAGTTTLFYQAAAPLGWTISAGFTDHTVWVNAASGGTTGGSSAYSAMFQAQWTSDGTAISIAQMPAHNHTDSGHTHTDSGHNHSQAPSTLYNSGATVQGGVSLGATTGSGLTANSSANISTSFANIQNTGGGGTHNHTKTFNAQYASMIMAVKT
jgi:hypothetical protein